MRELLCSIMLIAFFWPQALGQSVSDGKNHKAIFDQLSIRQRSIKQAFVKGNYQKCIRKSSYRISTGKRDRVAYYYMALSFFKQYQNELKEYLLDRSLWYLKSAKINSDPLVLSLKRNDQVLLDFIHEHVAKLGNESYGKDRSRSLKRLKYVAEIFEDTTVVYRNHHLASVQKHTNQKKIAVREIAAQDAEVVNTSLSDMVFAFLERELGDPDKDQSLAEFVARELDIEINSQNARLLNVAASEYGTADIPGRKHNPAVLKYFKDIGHGEIKSDEISWCSAYMSWCAKRAGMIYSKSLTARAWLNVGSKISVPSIGDVAVFWREKRNSWQGHVAIFLCQDEQAGLIYCLGGNQQDKVGIESYPTKRLLGYRRLRARK